MTDTGPGDQRRLVLRQEGLEDRSIQFFQRLNTDEDLRQQLIADPIGTIQHEVYGLDNPDRRDAALNQANRVLLSLLSNDGFMAWAQHFNETADPNTSREEVAAAIVRAAVEHGDKELLASLAAREPVRLRLGSDAGAGDVTQNLFCILDCSPVAVMPAQQNIAVFGSDKLRQVMSREDVAMVSRLFTEAIPERARQLRASGVLSSVDSATLGRQLSGDQPASPGG
jgi:hypothetical protein